MSFSEYLHFLNGPISITRARTPRELVESSKLPINGLTLDAAQEIWGEYVRSWGKVPMIREILASAPKEAKVKSSSEEGTLEASCDLEDMRELMEARCPALVVRREVASGSS